MTRQKIRVIKHEAVPDCGSYEVRFPGGRPSKYFYFETWPVAGCDLIGSNKQSPNRRQEVCPRRAGQARFAITASKRGADVQPNHSSNMEPVGGSNTADAQKVVFREIP